MAAEVAPTKTSGLKKPKYYLKNDGEEIRVYKRRADEDEIRAIINAKRFDAELQKSITGWILWLYPKDEGQYVATIWL